MRILDTEYWILDTGYWILDTGYWILDAGYWILDTGYWILDAGYWLLVRNMGMPIRVSPCSYFLYIVTLLRFYRVLIIEKEA